MQPQYVAGVASFERVHDAVTPHNLAACERDVPNLYVLSQNNDSLTQVRVRTSRDQDQYRSEVLSGGSEQRQYRRQKCLNPSKRLSHWASLPSFQHVAAPAMKKKLLSLSLFKSNSQPTSTKNFAGQACLFDALALHTFKAARGVMS